MDTRGQRVGEAMRSAASVAWPQLRVVGLTLLALAVVEILALAPPADRWSPSVWLVEAVGTASVALVTWLGAVALSTMLSLAGRRRPRPLAVALAAALSVVVCVHLWPLRPLKGVVPASVGLAVLAAAALALHWLQRRLLRRAGEPAGAPVVPTVALAAAAIWVNATFAAPGGAPSAPALAAMMLLYVVAVTVIGATVGRHRDLALVATMAIALAATVGARRDLGRPAGQARGEAAPSAPSVVLIVLDTVRADAVDLAADPAVSRTPNLAALARQADVYTAAVANASWSLPSHASLFTGLLPSRHRTDLTDEPGFGPRLDPTLPQAQELFAAAGYSTACVTANPLVGPQHGLARGFDRYRSAGRSWLWSTLPIRLLYIVTPGQSLPWILRQTVGLERDATAREIVDLAVADLAELRRPFYLFLNVMDAHAPYPVSSAEPLGVRLSLLRDQLFTQVGLLPLSQYALRHVDVLRRAYFDQMGELDAEVGRLVELLRHRGDFDSALIVVTSDHGEAMAENRSIPWYLGHQGAYEPVVRIPLIIKRPGQRAGNVFAHRVDLVDVLPTLLAAAGIEPPEELDGSALPRAAGPVVSEWYPRPRDRTGFTLPEKRLAFYRGPYKLVVGSGGEERLYDLRESPFEQDDVAAELPELARQMRADLDAALDAGAADPSRPRLDRATEEQLRALGYID